MKKLQKQEFFRRDYKENLSQVIHIIDEYNLYEHSLFKKTFNTFNMSKEQARKQTKKYFQKKVNKAYRQHRTKVDQLQKLTRDKDESISISEFGLKVWFQLPFNIGHSIDFQFKETLSNCYLRYMSILHIEDNKLKCYLTRNPNLMLGPVSKKVLRFYLIDLLVLRGTEVFIHENGIFPSVCPKLYRKKKQSLKFQVHFLCWEEQLFLVAYNDDLEYSLNVLSQIYKSDTFPIYLLTQSNWRHAFSKHFDQIYEYEELQDLSIEQQYEFVECQHIKMNLSDINHRINNIVFIDPKKQQVDCIHNVSTQQKDTLNNLSQSFELLSVEPNQLVQISNLMRNIELVVEDLILFEITVDQYEITQIKEYLVHIMESQNSINLKSEFVKCQNGQKFIIFLNALQEQKLLGGFYNGQLKNGLETLALLQIHNSEKMEKFCEQCQLFFEMNHQCLKN